MTMILVSSEILELSVLLSDFLSLLDTFFVRSLDFQPNGKPACRSTVPSSHLQLLLLSVFFF